LRNFINERFLKTGKQKILTVQSLAKNTMRYIAVDYIFQEDRVPLVSTVLMTAIPAKVAGVPEVCACTPPNAEGKINSDILAALYICGIKEVFAIAGVQAIAAMALGTDAVKPVDKIFGPGNAYVTEAEAPTFSEELESIYYPAPVK
jgi:histidinol dehydrogenase